jgi:hypothetical protein
VEAALHRIGGGVRVEELVYKTGLSTVEVLDALRQLERQGRARPWVWTAAAPTNEGDGGGGARSRRSSRHAESTGRGESGGRA